MPWFRRRSKEESRRRESEEAERQASVDALTAGGLPLNARHRMEHFRARDGAEFTSDLSVNEFLLAQHTGIRPLSLVMGSSITRIARPSGMSWGGSGEVVQLAEGINQTRERALGRLLEEAKLAGADAVVGVRISQKRFNWGAELIELTAIGTAVRLVSRSTNSEPSVTNLSGQEFWKLYTAGYWPVGICASTSVFQVYSSRWGNAGLMFGGYMNQELPDFSAGSYAARAAAISRIEAQAGVMRATGLVGVTIEQRNDVLQESEAGRIPIRMLFTFTAMGTAVVDVPRGERPEQAKISVDLA